MPIVVGIVAVLISALIAAVSSAFNINQVSDVKTNRKLTIRCY